MLRELRVSEMRYRAVLEVLDGAVISAVARRYGVSRQTVHAWLRRYAREGAVLNLEDRSSRPHGCPHQMAPELEARVLVLRDAHPRWGPTRIVYELEREGVVAVPGRSSVYRALVRNGRIDPARRRRRRADYKRWERGRPMELWQMDVVGGVHLGDGAEVKVITGIDDNSRFVVSAKVVARATARPVCEALVEALARHGVPEQILTDNGKVFTGRFGPGGSFSEVLFDRVCAENGIRHLLTAPRSPTTTGKVERLHKTMRAEFFTDADAVYFTIAELQAALDVWVVQYNTERPHQSLGMRPPAERFALAAPCPDPQIVDPIAAVAAQSQAVAHRPDLRHAGVRRWVDQRGSIRLAGFGYRVSGAHRAGRRTGRGGRGRQPGADLSPRGAGRLPCAASEIRHRTRGAAPRPARSPSGQHRDRGDPHGRCQRAGVVRRHHVPGRTGLAGKRSRGLHRRRVGADVL
jgi:transposase InsO family protein